MGGTPPSSNILVYCQKAPLFHYTNWLTLTHYNNDKKQMSEILFNGTINGHPHTNYLTEGCLYRDYHIVLIFKKTSVIFSISRCIR